jgi:2-dehydro-3-deoxy-D-pentonate aldolase
MLRLHGIIPPVVTPLNSQDELDVDGLDRLIEHLIQGGVHGLFVLGSCGEGPSLSYRLRREFIARVCERTAGRIPVLVGITDSSFSEAVALADFSEDAGAAAVVSSAPFYYAPSQTELSGFIARLHEEVSLPLIVYNMPGLTKVWFELQTITELCELPKLIGIKDSSGDLDYFASVAQILAHHRPDMTLMMGPEHLLASALERGGSGGVNGGANLFPHLFVMWYDALVQGDSHVAEQAEAVIAELQAIYQVGSGHAAVPKALKAGLKHLGICSDLPALPFERFNANNRARIADVLDSVADHLPQVVLERESL